MPHSSLPEVAGGLALFDSYLASLVTPEFLKLLKYQQHPWNEIETRTGHLYLKIAAFFAQPELISEIDSALAPFPQNLARDPSAKDVRYVASNFRGLYQRNGRQTLIGIGDALKVRSSNLWAHKVLHSVYMRALVRRSESINQLFLANTSLQTLSVHFAPESEGDSYVDLNGKNASITICNDIAKIWARCSDAWYDASTGVLESCVDLTGLGDDVYKREVYKRPAVTSAQAVLAETRERIILALHGRALELLQSQIFQSWLAMYHATDTPSAQRVVDEFELWVLSLAWLYFYCNPKHAGRHFYTVRLPELVTFPAARAAANGVESFALPVSSISVVSDAELSPEAFKNLQALPERLRASAQFDLVNKTLQASYAEFERDRIAKFNRDELAPLTFLLSPERAEDRQSVPNICVRRVKFLIALSRHLINRFHEGIPLRFCFIFGFSSERINSESKGYLTDVVSDLGPQWAGFAEHIKLYSDGHNIKQFSDKEPDDLSIKVAKAMATWIMGTDLPLQPWHTALFFEESPDVKWPIPTSIVRLTDRHSQVDDHIATEYQLRQALKEITRSSKTTIGLLVDKYGEIVFCHGKAVYLNHNDSGQIEPGAWGAEVDEDRFIRLLRVALSNSPFDKVSDAKRDQACEVISALCEALVTLGHGGLIVIRLRGGQIKELSPLNPTWNVLPDTNGPPLTKECILTYALLAALDGATEIELPEDNGPITLSVRRFVMPQTSVWEVRNGEVVLAEKFEGKVEPLRLIGRGTRHHSALALSADYKDQALVLTISADGPVSMWQDGSRVDKVHGDPTYEARFRPGLVSR